MLIPFQDFAVVTAHVFALHALDFIDRAELGATFRKIRKKDLSCLAFRARKQDVPFAGNESAHWVILGMWAEAFYTWRQALRNRFNSTRLK